MSDTIGFSPNLVPSTPIDSDNNSPASMTMQELWAKLRLMDAEKDVQEDQIKAGDLATGQPTFAGIDLTEAVAALSQLAAAPASSATAPIIPAPDVDLTDLALQAFAAMSSIFNAMAKGTTEQMKATDEARQKRAEESIKKLQESVKHANKAHKCGKITQVLQIVAVSLAVVACLAAVVATGGVGAPAAIAVIALMITSLDMANMIAQEEGCKTDFSLNGGFTAMGKKCGMSDEDAQWFGFGMSIGVQLMLMGGATAGTAAKAGASATQIARMGSTVRNITNMGAGAATAGVGAGTAGSAKETYEAAKKEAEAQELKAWVKKFQAQYEAMLKDLQDAIAGMKASGQNSMAVLKNFREQNHAALASGYHHA